MNQLIEPLSEREVVIFIVN